MKAEKLLLCFIISFFAVTLYGQEAPANAGEPPPIENAGAAESLPGEEIAEGEAEDSVEEEIEVLSGERRRIDMEIRTSTLPELAVWSRSLGLSESGTRDALAARIRGHYELPSPGSPPENQKVITIESAQTSEYFKIDTIDEDYARLKGDVRLSLKDGDAVHSIRADEILFNRTRNIITARGGVVYEKKDGDTTETFRGENITVNLDDWSGIFLDGISERAMGSEGTSYLFTGTVMSRSGEDVTILSNASISSANNPESLWSISASKIWLLPGSDFGIFNAVLKVGEIPILYLPFFFFPVDDLIFRPVIGYRSREGAFIQTTTYIFGRPAVDPEESSSISKIFGSANDSEQERHGIFLRNTGKKAVSTSETSLKAMLDYYINLGAYMGIDLSTPKTGNLNPVELSLGIGFTRTVTLDAGSFTPFYPDYDGTSDWNESNLFSMSVPFRYRLNFKSSFGGKYGSVSWNLPFYSDPYVERDFMNRAENMDFLNMLQDGSLTTDTSTLTQNEIGDIQWNISGNLNPSFPSLAPYISRISLSTISTTLQFKAIEDYAISNSKQYAPERYFYAPDKYTMYNFTATVSGTPVTIGGTTSQSSRNSAAAQAVQDEDTLGGIGSPISPWQDTENETEKRASDELLIPPALSQRFELPSAGNLKFDFDYQLSPSGSSELQFITQRWQSYDQVDWGDIESILTGLSGRGDLNFRLNHSAGLFSNVLTFSGNGTWRDYNYLNEEADRFLTNGVPDQDKIDAERRLRYSQTNYTSSYSYTGTLRPIYQNQIFGQSNLQYSLRSTLVKSMKYADNDGPELRPQWGQWVKEDLSKDILGLNRHRISANLIASVFEKQQNFTVNVDLPPLDQLVETSATFRFWISETAINTRFEKPEDAEEWIFKPINITETLRFSGNNQFRYYMVIDPEEEYEITNITVSLTLWSFRASLTAEKTYKYKFDLSTTTWVAEGETSLYPKQLLFSYNHTFSNVELIKNRIFLSVDIRSSLDFNLIQHTNSNFQISMGLNLNIPGFLELRLAATSTNSVIWRYFKGIPGLEDLTFMYLDGPQNNLFTDLLDSFNFFDESKRRRSGFKMSSLDLTATHHLGDWKAILDLRTYPYFNNSLQQHEFTADVSFLVQWTPISELKTDFEYTRDTKRWVQN